MRKMKLPYRNYTGKRFRNDAEREQVLYIMALTRTDHAQKIAGRIQEQLGGRVRVMLYPANSISNTTNVPPGRSAKNFAGISCS